MNIEILTADKSLYVGEAEKVTFPGADGSFGVLDHHAPMIASLKAGTIVLDNNGQEEKIEVKVQTNGEIAPPDAILQSCQQLNLTLGKLIDSF